MKTSRFEVLSQNEVERIHAVSMEILAKVGVKVSYKKARDIFREAGAAVDEQTFAVKLPEKLVRRAVDQAPKQFSLYGINGGFSFEIGLNQTAPVFAGPAFAIFKLLRKIDWKLSGANSCLKNDEVAAMAIGLE